MIRASTPPPPSRNFRQRSWKRSPQSKDFSFSFSQPGFYALLAHLKATTAPPGHTAGATEINDWNVLLERPAEFRGRAITIEGTVGRNSSWQLQQEPYREFGTVTQLELTQPDQVIAATVILTNPAGDIPIGNRVRITGYFVMIRQYYSASKRLCQAALFVAHGPTEVSEVVAIPQTKPLSSTLLGLAIAFFAAMIVVWFLLRKNTMAGRRGSGELHASRAAPFSVADDLEKWAGEDDDASNEPSAEDDESQC